MENDILIIVDYQNDFVSPDGAVAKKLGNDILQSSQDISIALQNLIIKFHETKKQVLFLVSDYSLKNYSGEIKKHKKNSAYGNITQKNTWGYELYKIKGTEEDVFIVKSFFDGFFKSSLEEYLKSKNIKNIYICGVNTDFCVFHTAIGAMNRGYQVFVIEDATATITKNKKLFLNYLSQYVGIKIIKTKNL